MKTHWLVLLFFSIITFGLIGCSTVPSRPVVVGSPVRPENPAFGQQVGRNISAPQKPVGCLSIVGVPSATVKVINNSGYLICIVEGPVWMYPDSEPFTVSLDRVARSFNSRNTNLTIQVFLKNGGDRPLVTMVSPDYWIPYMDAYSRTEEHVLVLTNKDVENWMNGNRYWR